MTKLPTQGFIHDQTIHPCSPETETTDESGEKKKQLLLSCRFTGWLWWVRVINPPPQPPSGPRDQPSSPLCVLVDNCYQRRRCPSLKLVYLPLVQLTNNLSENARSDLFAQSD